MILVLLVAGLAAALGVFRGGSLHNLAATELSAPWIVLAALVVQVVVDLFGSAALPDSVTLVLLLGTYAAIATFLLVNRHLPGMAVAAAGLGMNAVVIALNGAMPVSRWAAEIAGIDTLIGFGVKHEPAGPDTVLSFFGDVIPIPNTFQILSVGDVVLAAGLALLVYRRTRTPRELPPTTVSD